MGRSLNWAIQLTSEGEEEVAYDISPEEMSLMIDLLDTTDTTDEITAV